MFLLMIVSCSLAFSSGEVLNINAAIAKWPMGESKARINLFLQRDVKLDEECQPLANEKCMVYIKACPVPEKSAVIIPDECKKYMKDDNMVQSVDDPQNNELLEESDCFENEVTLKDLMKEPNNGYLPVTGLKGNTMYAVAMTEMVNGSMRKWRTFPIATPAEMGYTERRMKKGFNLDQELKERELGEDEKKNKQKLLKRLLEYLSESH